MMSTASQATQFTKSNDSIWVQIDDRTGLITSLPATTSETLIEQMEALRTQLQAKKTRWARIAEEQAFSLADSLIAIVMPGGILYAAIIEQRHSQAIKRLKDANTHLDDMTQNLTEYRLTIMDQTIMIATL